MNILIVTGIFPPDRGGPASYVPRIAAALLRRGHQVEVVCLSDRLKASADSAFPFPVRRIRRSMFWPWRLFVTTLTIWSRARAHDLVYVNGLGAEAALAALLARRPAVHKIVGDYAWERAAGRGWFRGTIDEYQRTGKGFLLRLLDAVRTVPLRLADAIIVPSNYLARVIAGWGIPREKIQTIFNAAVLREPVGDIVPLPPWGGKTLITVCRLVPWKGVDALIALVPKMHDIRLIIIGDGSMRGALEDQARVRGVAERVIFLGQVSPDAVHGYLRQADAFVLNSTYEGLPHVVLEAMAAGVPVIATNAGGTSEVVEDGVTGFLVPVGNEPALKAAIERLWRDPQFGVQMAAQAAVQLRTRFDFDAMVTATETALRAAVPHQMLPHRAPLGELR